MPTYEHRCEKCGYEWEDVYKISDPIPESCPSCLVSGFIKRLINWDGAGNVRLNPKDAARKAWADGKVLAHQAKTDENLKANIIGEEKYHQSELTMSKAADEAKHVIKNSRPTIKYKND